MLLDKMPRDQVMTVFREFRELQEKAASLCQEDTLLAIILFDDSVRLVWQAPGRPLEIYGDYVGKNQFAQLDNDLDQLGLLLSPGGEA